MKNLLLSSKLLFVIASVLLVFGISLPLITVSKLVVVSTTYTLLSGVFELLLNGQLILFFAVFLFSIVLPLAKMFCLFKVIFSKTGIYSAEIERYVKLMHDFGRWAMLDVMVVAVLIVASKLSVLANVDVHVGLYLFGLSVIIVMVLTHRAAKLTSI
jgi:paraquat-inducible protein A